MIIDSIFVFLLICLLPISFIAGMEILCKDIEYKIVGSRLIEETLCFEVKKYYTWGGMIYYSHRDKTDIYFRSNIKKNGKFLWFDYQSNEELSTENIDLYDLLEVEFVKYNQY